ncbi:unnamed protein product [Brassicogethes aeneus]|uniref:C2H2-type domain-containing protein n=1 Tax=Brassicogethes aeneus TaxID=1431903 RepID=A0A9P0BK81_BRAAE|nr:unnamed protein product [Brassicogethes aeneus]
MSETASYNLMLIFKDILSNKKIKLELSTISKIIKEDLSINLDDLSQNIKDVLLRMIIVYIRSWPGWGKSSDFFDGVLSLEEWFKRFKEYLNYKLKYIIKNGYKENVEIVKKENNEKLQKKINNGLKAEHGTQTDNLAPKGYAPFTICIECTPDIINTLVFTQADNTADNLVLRKHPAFTWENISFQQLLNWPFVEVQFDSPELKFGRKNVTDYTRYISLTTCPLKHDKDEFIDEIDFFDKRNTSRSCYTLKFLESYCNTYVKTLIDLSAKYLFIQKGLIQDVKVLLGEFLSDIKELNINNSTMATNTTITFNIGRSNYVRVKKLTRGNHKGNNQIGYCEFITPKIELILKHFAAVQEPNHSTVTFTHLNNLLSIHNDSLPLIKSAVPRLSFRCRFCQVSLDCKAAIFEHFATFHRSEQNVVCFRCKVSYPLPDITKLRWDHNCKSKEVTVTNKKVQNK